MPEKSASWGLRRELLALILIVDDTRDILLALKAAIEFCGHTPVMASDGNEALQTLDREKPDLIFLDYHMPGLSGLDVLQVLREHPREKLPPVVMITNDVNPDVRVKALALGAAACLPKLLVSFDDLKSVIGRYLECDG